MGINSNMQNGSIATARKHAFSPSKKKNTSNATNNNMNKNNFFEDKDGEQQRRKALVSHRTDNGEGYCMRCYKGPSYKHGHHNTCS